MKPTNFHKTLFFTLYFFLLTQNSVYAQVTTYLDEFESELYSNNDGTGNFSANWIEINETTDPTTDPLIGNVVINLNQLRFRTLNTKGIGRSLDLSRATDATLTLDYETTRGNSTIFVQLFDGTSFNTRATLVGTGTINYTLTAAEMSANSEIRFVSGSGTWRNNDAIYVDNVQFTATLVPDPCTDPAGLDSDGDGINDVCDLDDDNDGILDTEECSGSTAPNLIFNGDFSSFYFDGWTPDGSNWQEPGPSNAYAFYEEYNTGTRALQQTLNVVSGTAYNFSFEVGTVATYPNSSTLNVYIDGVLLYSRTSDQINADGGGDTTHTGGGNLSNTTVVTLPYTPTSSSVLLSFEGVSAAQPHDEFFLDNVSLTASNYCSDMDGDGIANSLDLDSDGDGCFDAIEGAAGFGFTEIGGTGVLTGSVDANGVPISASGGQAQGSSKDLSTTAGICDDDGDGVDNDNDVCPYSDDSIDTDGDFVPDGCDIDDDNDGITDCVESSDSLSEEFAWTLNSPSGNLNMDTNYDPRITDWVLNSTGTMVLSGEGATYDNSASQVRINTFNAQDYNEALTNKHYIEVSFTTGSEVSSLLLNNIRSGWYEPSRGDSYYSTTMYTEASSNAWKTLSSNVFHTYSGSGIYDTFQHNTGVPVSLNANTEYKFRLYIYGQIDDTTEAYSIFDDVAFVFTACRAEDSDNDGIDNHLDTDSDDDGCTDADEAYGDSNTDLDNNGKYGSGSPSVNADGSVTAASYATPADGDTSGNFDFLETGIAIAITTEPTDEIVCRGENTSFEVVASNSDNYQWQILSGGTWTDLSDSEIHSGSATSTLTITNAQLSDSGNKYRVIATSSSYACSTETSNEVTLTVSEPTITVTDSPTCNLFFTAYSLEVTVSSGNVTSSAGTVTNSSGNVWNITNIPAGTDIVVTVTDVNNCTADLPVTAPDCRCPIVNAPVSGGDESYCAGNPVATITASVGLGETVDWYDSSSGGTLLLTNNTSYTPSGPGTYFAEARNTTTNCISGTRTAISVSEDAAPTTTIGADQTVFAGDNAQFTVSATNANTYQWQVSTDGVSFIDISNGTEYSGALSNTLTLISAQQNMTGFLYRVLVSDSSSSCSAVASSSALLTVNVKTVITNKRITYRVKIND